MMLYEVIATKLHSTRIGTDHPWQPPKEATGMMASLGDQLRARGIREHATYPTLRRLPDDRFSQVAAMRADGAVAIESTGLRLKSWFFDTKLNMLRRKSAEASGLR